MAGNGTFSKTGKNSYRLEYYNGVDENGKPVRGGKQLESTVKTKKSLKNLLNRN
jgi:hypothetical protein